MARQSGIWWWKSRNCYYCWHNGQQHRLDPNKAKATRKWAELIGRTESTGENMPVANLLNAYLDWSEANHAKKLRNGYGPQPLASASRCRRGCGSIRSCPST